MSGTGRHASAPALWFPTRLGVTTGVAALVALAAIIGAVAVNSPGPRPLSATRPAPAAAAAAAAAGRPGASITRVPGGTVAIARANAVPALTGSRHQPDSAPSVAAPARRATMPLVLT